MSKTIQRLITVSFLAVVAGILLFQLPGQDTAVPPQIVVPGSTNGVVLLPQTPATLTVQVSDAQGNPQSGVSVLFLAPDSGASGAFTGADSDNPNLIRAQTDDNGLASAEVTANDSAGVYLLDAIVEGTESGVTFGVTNVLADLAPALPPDQARQAVEQQFGADSAQAVIHGPVLLPASTQVAAGGKSTPLFVTAPYQTDRLTWFFWRDELPGGMYQHPTRFIFVDASNSTPDLTTARVSKEGWWPQIALPGATGATALIPPSATRASIPPPAPAAAFLHSLAARLLPFATPAETCVISIYGPPDGALENDASHFASFAKDVLNVPAVNIYQGTNLFTFSRPASPGMLQSFINQVKAKGCKKLFLLISAHGTGDEVVLTDDGNTGAKTYLSFTDLAAMLSTLKDNKTEVCLIVNACFSAGGMQALQNQGISGVMVTSDRGGYCLFPKFAFGRGSLFVTALLECWKDPAASSVAGAQATLPDAFTWTKKNGGGRANNGNPQIETIDPNGGTIDLPSVVVAKSGDTVTFTINRPAGAVGGLVFKVTIDDPSVSNFGGGAAQTVKALQVGQNSTTLQVTGVKDGLTAYTVETSDDNNKKFSGFSSILVGSGYFVDPSPIQLKVGETAMANLVRVGSLARAATGPVTLTISPKDTISGTIASVTPTSATFAVGSSRVPLTIKGLAPGTATFTATDPVTKLSTTFQVIVTGTPIGACPMTGTMDMQFAVVTDLDHSASFVGLMQGRLTFTRMNSQIMVTGDRAQLVPATGPFDAANCAFKISPSSSRKGPRIS